MRRQFYLAMLAGILGMAGTLAAPTPAHAQGIDPNRYNYYPYYYFPHNYWPNMSPQWPEAPGTPYRPAPAYMAYPPFHEAQWRYELWQGQRYYRGFHFWLDQF
jgi:hypothetical protein